jgi:hypothetical protein
VELHVEREATRVLRMLRRIEDHLGIKGDEEDPYLDRMMEELDPEHLLRDVEESLEESGAAPPDEAGDTAEHGEASR